MTGPFVKVTDREKGVGVWVNLSTVRTIVWCDSQDQPYTEVWFEDNAFIEAEETPEEILQKAGVEVRYCEECSEPFIPSDRRQRFCPPPPGKRESLCGLRHRQRKCRERHKQAVTAE